MAGKADCSGQLHDVVSACVIVSSKEPLVSGDKVRSYCQKEENGGRGDVEGVIYPLEGDQTRAAVFFASAESANRVCSTQHKCYTITPAPYSVFSSLEATVGDEAWPASRESSYLEFELEQKGLKIENTSSGSKKIIGNWLQVVAAEEAIARSKPQKQEQLNSSSEVTAVVQGRSQAAAGHTTNAEKDDVTLSSDLYKYMQQTGHKLYPHLWDVISDSRSSVTVSNPSSQLMAAARRDLKRLQGQTITALSDTTEADALQSCHCASAEGGEIGAAEATCEAESTARLRSRPASSAAAFSFKAEQHSEIPERSVMPGILKHVGQQNDIDRAWQSSGYPAGNRVSTAKVSRAPVDRKCFQLARSLEVLVYCGDITEVRIEAIANPANEDLVHAGGAALAIAKASGQIFNDISDEYISRHGKLSVTGTVAFNTSGALKTNGVKYVINAVGPQWKAFSYDDKTEATRCRRDLERTIYNILSIASRYECTSVAIPAISSGIFRVPMNICTEAYVSGVIKFAEESRHSLSSIHLVNIDQETTDSIKRAFEDHFASPQSLRMSSERAAVYGGMSLSSDYLSARSQGSQEQVARPSLAWETDDSAGIHPPSDSIAHSKHSDDRHRKEHKPHVDPRSSSDHMVRHSAGVPSSSGRGNEGTRELLVRASRAWNVDDSLGTRPPAVPLAHNESWSPEQFQQTSSLPFGNEAFGDARQRGVAMEWSSSTNGGLSCAQSSTSPSYATAPSGGQKSGAAGDEACPICMDSITSPRQLPCGHTYCSSCIGEHERVNAARCPICQRPFGDVRGNQPKGGSMTVSKISSGLPGYTGFGTIVIDYNIPDGVQDKNHPQPGKRFSGASRRAYLPDSPEGQSVLVLLRKAFNQGLTFTVGTSHTTGLSNTVVWNDIHHKTATHGGPTCYGYPDPDYLKRLREELAAKGVR